MPAQPFIYYSNCTAPCTAEELKHGLPTRNNSAGAARGYSATPPRDVAACPPGGCPPNWLSADDPLLEGFDRDFVELIFEKMLTLPVTFRSYGSFVEAWMAVLQGFVDVVVTASNVDPQYALCGPDGPATQYAYTYDCAPGGASGGARLALALPHQQITRRTTLTRRRRAAQMLMATTPLARRLSVRIVRASTARRVHCSWAAHCLLTVGDARCHACRSQRGQQPVVHGVWRAIHHLRLCAPLPGHDQALRQCVTTSNCRVCTTGAPPAALLLVACADQPRPAPPQSPAACLTMTARARCGSECVRTLC